VLAALDSRDHRALQAACSSGSAGSARCVALLAAAYGPPGCAAVRRAAVAGGSWSPLQCSFRAVVSYDRFWRRDGSALRTAVEATGILPHLFFAATNGDLPVGHRGALISHRGASPLIAASSLAALLAALDAVAAVRALENWLQNMASLNAGYGVAAGAHAARLARLAVATQRRGRGALVAADRLPPPPLRPPGPHRPGVQEGGGRRRLRRPRRPRGAPRRRPPSAGSSARPATSPGRWATTWTSAIISSISSLPIGSIFS